jgi:hypothetical protein
MGVVMTAMIQVHGPHNGNFVAQFLTADGRSLSILVPEGEAEVLRDIQELMPYGLAVRDVADASAHAELPKLAI